MSDTCKHCGDRIVRTHSAIFESDRERLSDAEWREFQQMPEEGVSHRRWVDGKIAARLAAVKAENEHWRGMYDDAMAQLRLSVRETTEARAKCAGLSDLAGDHKARAEKAEAERDEAQMERADLLTEVESLRVYRLCVEHHGGPDGASHGSNGCVLCLMYRADEAEAEVTSLRDQVAAVEALIPAECWVLRSPATGPTCTDMIGGGFNSGAKWTEEMCCLPCRIRRCITDPGETLRARDERVWAEGYERAALDRYEALFDPGGKSRNPYTKAGESDGE